MRHAGDDGAPGGPARGRAHAGRDKPRHRGVHHIEVVALEVVPAPQLFTVSPDPSCIDQDARGYVLEGEGSVLLDGEEHPVRPGSMIHIPPGVVHGAVGRMRVLVVGIPDIDDDDVFYVDED